MIKDTLRSLLGKLKWLRFRILYPRAKFDPNGFYCGRGCFISRSHELQVGANFYMGNYCHLASSAVIGEDVLFASFVSLVGGDHKFDNIDVPMRASGTDVPKTTEIASNVWLGHGCLVMHGVKIGSGAVVAAKSVVTSDVAENAIVAGNPARFIRYRSLKDPS